MLIKIVLIAWCAAAASGHAPYGGSKPSVVPQVGISKGVRSQSPDIIYLSGHDDHHGGVPLGPHGQLDQNNVIAAVYGPAFLRPEWIWTGDHQRERHESYGRGQQSYDTYDRESDNSDPYGRGEKNRELYGRGENSKVQYGAGRGTLEPRELHQYDERQRARELTRVRNEERLDELKHQQEEGLRLRENERLVAFLREKEQETLRQLGNRPSGEMERMRQLERQRAREHTQDDGIGGRPYPGYDYPEGRAGAVRQGGYTGVRYADAGYRGEQAPHGWEKGYRPAWARLPDVSFHGRYHGMGPNKAEH